MHLKTADRPSDLSILMAWCFHPADDPEMEPRTYKWPYPDRYVQLGKTAVYANLMLEDTDCRMIDEQLPISIIFYGTALALFRDLSMDWEYRDCIQVYMYDILARVVCHEMTHQLSVPDNPDTTCDDPFECDCVMDPWLFGTYLLDNLSTDPDERCRQLAERWKNMMNTGIRRRHQEQACTVAELLKIQATVE
jgi:hypothetical protein